MSEILVNTIKKADGTGGLTVPTSTGDIVVSSGGALPALDGSALTGIASQPDVAYLYLTGSNQGISTNSWTKLELNGTVVDTQSAWDGTNYRYQPTVAGYYNVTVSAHLSGSGGTYRFISIYKSGGAVGYFQMPSGGGSEVRIEITRLVYLNGSSDYIEGYVYTEATSGVSINKDDQGRETGMWIHLVRAD